jgi:hypothetical protein
MSAIISLKHVLPPIHSPSDRTDRPHHHPSPETSESRIPSSSTECSANTPRGSVGSGEDEGRAGYLGHVFTHGRSRS